MVGEKHQSCSQEPPIRVRGGIIIISDRSGRAMQGKNPQNHRGKRREDRPSHRPRSRRRGPSRPIGRREEGSVQRVVRVHVLKTATWVKARPRETSRPWRTARPWETARPHRKWAPPQNIGGEALKPETQKVGRTPKNFGETPETQKVSETPKNSGETPETQKVGGTLKNSGETLKNRRDREIGGSVKTGVAGSMEDHRRPRNLDDGPSHPLRG